MTAGQRYQQRPTVLERDGHTCRRCGTDDDTTELRCYRVDDDALAEPIDESALVTVCAGCWNSLRTETDVIPALEADDCFSLVRTTTEREGVTVSAVAAFASLTTGLPSELEAAAADGASIDAQAAEYRQARREVLLAIESVDTELDSLHAISEDALEPAINDAVGEFTGTATKLQSELRGIVALGETIVAGLERCHGCFDPLEAADRQCKTCGLERRDVSDWRRGSANGDVDFEALYEAINETLQTASATTEALTARTTAVATTLKGDGNDR
ncbi:HNH endonuclease [Salinadaptatus halalkaliphilus]|uniref:HNH endonuclease n=1 Tax=Salinadaptatus halalkaliphilus TaxID=2419781 RepID=A0A4V3VLM9_9EURY|nr:HNH endonuclease [Salinadaptatus halalkaliphilus]THE66237.1 HNH endonuclease [Salinadaptatus halalkaliphilus]